MAYRNTSTHYGWISVVLHWVIAAAILAMLFLGFTAAASSDPGIQRAVLSWHVPLGIAILIFMIFRFAWNYLGARPSPPAGLARWQVRIAHVGHLMLYVLTFAICTSGVALMAISGGTGTLFSSTSEALPDFKAFAPWLGHVIGAFALVALLLAHVLAALWHQFIRRDALFSRMGIGGPARLPHHDTGPQKDFSL